MPSTPPQAGPGARQARPATTTQAPRRLGLALAVIATAQLMIVLDLTIVTVALPHIQQALGFSGSNLEWVVNAYAVTFGGLLLLGGRSGDLLGRRRVFIAGLVVFTLASLLGGLAAGQAWLITARAVQGAGAAMAAPTALSLIAVTFPEGPPRNGATAVYSAMSILGSVVGLIAGGLLVTYLSYSTFAGGILGPQLVLGTGLGMVFVLTFLVGLTKVSDNDAGVASSLVNVGQQVGGSIGLAVLGTVAWSAVASSLRSQAAAAVRAGVHATGAQAALLQARVYHHALATGFSRGYLVSAGFLALAAIIALAMIRVSRQDLSGGNPMPEPAADAPAPSRP